MPNGELLPSQYTETGYVSNQFTVGPALLWAPFLCTLYKISHQLASFTHPMGDANAIRRT
jgi:hypothetical protein